jgi:hypothetical protein
MQYTFSPKLKMASLVALIVGAIVFGIGVFLNIQDQANPDFIPNMVKENPEVFYGEYQSAEYKALNFTEKGEEAQMHMWKHQLANRPWAAFLVPAYYAFGIAGAALFFMCVQFAANAGWSMVVTRVMEGIASFIPYAGILILIIMIAAAFGLNHLFHWMDPTLIDLDHENYDIFIASKSKIWLNTPGWLARSVLYVVLWTVFLYWIKKSTKEMDANQGNRAVFEKLFTRAVLFIVVFALTTAPMAWDWVMGLDPHWYSTLFMWYGMVSYLVAAVAIMAMISIYFKNKGALPLFNDNHQHDLAKYMFGFSLLWSYLWYDQFMLQWYANIPEEVQYFQQRNAQYPGYYWMLIVNLFAPLVIMMSSSIKRVQKLVFAMGILIIIGHYWDFYNQIMPGAVGAFHNFGFLEIGALLFVTGAFIYVVFEALSKLNLEPKGHPFFHESKIYEYPF